MMARAKPRIRAVKESLRAKFSRYWYPREYLIGFCFLSALGLGSLWGSWQNLCAGDACPSIAQIRTFQHEQKSRILAHDGQQIMEIGFESRTPVSLRALQD